MKNLLPAGDDETPVPAAAGELPPIQEEGDTPSDGAVTPDDTLLS